MGAEQGDQLAATVLPTLDLHKVKEKLQAHDNSSATKSKTDIFSPRSPVYRTPLSSRRNNGNLPLGSGNAPGLILPQARFMGSLQQQHLQRNGISLYSPRSKGNLHAGLHGQTPASGISPRQAHRSPIKDYTGSNLHSNMSSVSQPAAHAASAASRPAIPHLRLQQQQPQLFSPRLYIKPALLEGLSARAAPQHTSEYGSHVQQGQQGGGTLTWRGQPPSSHHAGSLQQLQQIQPSYTSPSVLTTSRDSTRPTATPVADSSSSSATPLTPSQALKAHSHALTGYEQSEILNQQDIYFLGLGANKIEGQPHSSDLNHGYDDEWGDMRMVVGDHIGYRFEILSRLGKGSFGQVFKCRDHKTGEMCALKVIRNQKRFHKQALVEIKILEHLRNQDSDGSCCVVHIRESLSFRSHLCISFELLSINLYDYIKANNFKGSSLRLIRKFAYQVLVCLRFLRRQKVLHCDLKPENILLKEDGRSGIKVIDFGSSCFEGEQVYSYIQSRFYRSPEVMLGLRYATPIDMWSLACILAELYTGYPLFPGENEVEQMQCVMEIMGPPPAALMERATRKEQFFEADGSVRITANKAGLCRFPGSKDLSQALRCNDGPFLSFLQACLKWDPQERLTPEEALQHPWVQSTEPAAPAPIPVLTPASTGWTPRNLNPSSTWLSRLQTDLASQAARDGNRGSYTSRRAPADAGQGLNLLQPSIHGSGGLSHRGSKPYAGTLTARRN